MPPTRLNTSDCELLTTIAEYRMLTVNQIACLDKRARRTLRRAVLKLEDAGLVQATSGFGRAAGRPEKILSLTPRGAEVLTDAKILGPEAMREGAATAMIRSVDHLLLVNWFRIHLLNIERLKPQLKTRFLSAYSPFLPRGADDQPLIHDLAPMNGDDQMIGFVPDGVFVITHAERQKTLLFFLEVDMGTETITSRRRDQRDIRQKVITYQEYFRSGRYKRYQQVFAASLRGFRLLFLTSSRVRLGALCQLVQSMRPSDFIWLTDQDGMFDHGVGAPIWARGGSLRSSPESVLARQLSDAPATGLEISTAKTRRRKHE